MRTPILIASAILCSQAVGFAQSVKEQLPPATKERGVAAPPARMRRGGPRIVIPQLTELQVVLRDQIKSDYTKEGSEIIFFVGKNVFGPEHELLIPAGASAVGRLVRTIKARPFGVAGYVYLTCDYVLTADGTRIPLRAITLDIRGRDQKGESAFGGIWAAALAIGLVENRGGSDTEKAAVSLIGPIVGAFIQGKNTTVQRGARFHMAVDADTSVLEPVAMQPEDLPDLIRPRNLIPEGPVRRVLIRMADGDFTVGLMRRKGDYLIITNSVETRKVKMADVREISYLSRVGDEED